MEDARCLRVNGALIIFIDYITFRTKTTKTYARELLDKATAAVNSHPAFNDRLTIPPALARWARQQEAQKQGVALATRFQHRGMEIEVNLIPREINLVLLRNYFVDRLYNLITPQIETCMRVCACARVLSEGD
jgi:hypothetical protein